MSDNTDSESATRSPQNLTPTSTSRTTPFKSSLKQQQQREEILADLRREPVSLELQAYFDGLRGRPPKWDIETFIEGVKSFADLFGVNRARYYENGLLGLHYPRSFAQLWDKNYPDLSVTPTDFRFGRQCPSSWWSDVAEEHGWLVAYVGTAPLSQGLNELLRGPTTIDCGMFCQLLLWMAIRYLLGDAAFDARFKFGKGKFVLTPHWDTPLNILWPFYDKPHLVDTDQHIQTLTFFNHDTYVYKHPGSEDRLHNVTRIDGLNYTFDPSAEPNVLSDAELNQKLLAAYNDPPNEADMRSMMLFAELPDYLHPDFKTQKFRAMGDLAQEHAGKVLSEDDWNASQTSRDEQAQISRQVFNFGRFQESFEFYKEDSEHGIVRILLRAMKSKEKLAGRLEAFESKLRERGLVV